MWLISFNVIKYSQDLRVPSANEFVYKCSAERGAGARRRAARGSQPAATPRRARSVLHARLSRSPAFLRASARRATSLMCGSGCSACVVLTTLTIDIVRTT